MSAFTILLVCVQIFLIQNASSQYLSRGLGCGCGTSLGGYGAGWTGLGNNWNGLGTESAYGGYGGEGIGNLEVVGELPVAGTTAINGRVPIIGAVGFGGEACAVGTVCISGHCGPGCGCGIY